MSAGPRDKLIAFQRASTGRGPSGAQTEIWATLVREWASIFWGQGSERRQAAAERGAQSATFQVLDNALTRSVTIKDRISFNGTWDITGIATPKAGEIEFTGVRAS